MTSSATRKDTTKPSAMLSQPTAALVIRSPFFSSSSVVAPSIVGMARKKLNSAAVRRSTPSVSAPMMVAPDRLTPGTIARHWMKPMPITRASGMSAMPWNRSCFTMRSISRMAMPPAISAQATTCGAPSSISI